MVPININSYSCCKAQTAASHEIQNSLNKKEHRSTAFMRVEDSHPLPLTVPAGQLWNGCLQTTWKMMKMILKQSQSELWSNLFSMDKIMDLPSANSIFPKRSPLLFHPVRDKKGTQKVSHHSKQVWVSPKYWSQGQKKTPNNPDPNACVGSKFIMHSFTQVSCLSGDQRVRRKFFVNQCYLWCGHKSYRRSLHWANTHSLTGDLEEYFPGEKTGLRKIDSSFFWFFFLHYASTPSMGLGAHWKMNSDNPYLTGSETCRLLRCSTSRKFNKLCQKDMSIDWKFTDVYVFFFP